MLAQVIPDHPIHSPGSSGSLQTCGTPAPGIPLSHSPGCSSWKARQGSCYAFLGGVLQTGCCTAALDRESKASVYRPSGEKFDHHRHAILNMEDAKCTVHDLSIHELVREWTMRET